MRLILIWRWLQFLLRRFSHRQQDCDCAIRANRLRIIEPKPLADLRGIDRLPTQAQLIGFYVQ